MDPKLKEEKINLLKEKLQNFCSSAINLAKNYPDCKTFYLQTILDKKETAKLDDFEEQPFENCFAIKNQLNKIAVGILSSAGLKLNQSDPHLHITFDFKENKVSLKHSNIYIFAHYLKKSREFAQHIWACPSCKGKGCKNCNFKKEKFPSIESALRDIFIKAFSASDLLFHASGREDVDVMTLGSGRPCVIEIVNPKKHNLNLNELAEKLKQSYPIELIDPIFVKKFFVEAVCNSHFNKVYLAKIGSKTRNLNKEDFLKISKNLPILIKQRTPTRVLKRRSDLIRPRHIFDISLKSINDGKLELLIYAEAGTYIKEFVSGDDGRTNPSISSILGIDCICEELTLIEVKDFFIKTLLLN
jgi:tRNA pseudouridine synthase 10